MSDLPGPFALIDDLIAMERTANRPKDQTHVMEREALRRLIRSGAEQQDGARS